ncbi:MAG: hypothetical protein ACI9KA_001076 [Parasphingorhabdus sp.]|jgi:hypothetical protein|uniref:hypothetical protein n=1 Tax=Parasphingorhabdus sp. TaxID=2709688 RepID=UPI0039E3BF85
MDLTDEQLESCQLLIDDKPNGEYEIKEIYGDFYESILAPKDFGKKFKHAVEQGKLDNIKLGRMDTGDKHWRYNLHGFLLG